LPLQVLQVLFGWRHGVCEVWAVWPRWECRQARAWGKGAEQEEKLQLVPWSCVCVCVCVPW